jgi:hypothetical protein
VTADADNNLYVSDYNNSRVRRISNGRVTTIITPGVENGIFLKTPYNLTIDTKGNLIVADWGTRD